MAACYPCSGACFHPQHLPGLNQMAPVQILVALGAPGWAKPSLGDRAQNRTSPHVNVRQAAHGSLPVAGGKQVLAACYPCSGACFHERHHPGNDAACPRGNDVSCPPGNAVPCDRGNEVPCCPDAFPSWVVGLGDGCHGCLENPARHAPYSAWSTVVLLFGEHSRPASAELGL